MHVLVVEGTSMRGVRRVDGVRWAEWLGSRTRRGAFAPNLLIRSGVPVIVSLDVLIAIGIGVIILNGGRRSVPYVAVAALVFTIVLSRAAPNFGSQAATDFEHVLTYMGYQVTK